MEKLYFNDVGEGINEGTIINWCCKVGDKVKEGDVLVVIETDKLDAKLPAPATGTIKQILFKEGDVVQVGDLLIVIE